MAITNISKPANSVTNTSKVSVGETWGSILTTWASETRTWQAISQLITDLSRPVGGTVGLWFSSAPWQLALPWQYTTSASAMTNLARPS